VHYSYTIGSRVFEADTIQFGQDGSGRKKDAVATIVRFPRGSHRRVFYNPQAPQICCLEPGKFEQATNIWVVLGLGATMMGIAMLAWQLFTATLPPNVKLSNGERFG
jgi:hypothetical protein